MERGLQGLQREAGEKREGASRKGGWERVTPPLPGTEQGTQVGERWTELAGRWLEVAASWGPPEQALVWRGTPVSGG